MTAPRLSGQFKAKPLRGAVLIPGDKSITHRAIILSALAKGRSRIQGYLPSEDCERTLAAFQSMRISIQKTNKSGKDLLEVEGKGLKGLTEPEDVIDCGNSGTTMRLMSGLLSGQSFFSVLTGDQSLRKRPMKRVIEPLRLMGAEISGRAEGTQAPLAISGKALKPVAYHLPIASAQVKSAILLAGLCTEGRTTVYEPGPSRDHTERMFEFFEVPFKKKGAALSVEGGGSFQARDINIPGDISSAAFFLVAGSIVPGSEIMLKNVGLNPSRTGVLEVLQKMGADIQIQPLSSSTNEPVADLIVRFAPLKATLIEGPLMTAVIDEFPILCVAAARAEGTTVFRDGGELRVKESDRIERMAEGLRGMGLDLETHSDGISIEGRADWKSTACKTDGDHRIAMSMTVAGLLTDGGNHVDDLKCINTSFPGFLTLLSQLAVT